MNEACCCIDVDYPAELEDHTWRNARKEHKCGECGVAIAKGEHYEYSTILFDGNWSHGKTCWFCVRIREDFFPCGYYYGELRNDFRDCNGWDYCELPEDDE